MSSIRTVPLLVVAVTISAAPAAAQPVVSAVLNGASYHATLSPGCWAVIYGAKLAPAETTATNVPLPTSLGNVSVTVAGVQAPLLYVSPTQVNALIPFEVTIPSNSVLPAVVPVVVTTPEGANAPYSIRLTRTAPAIFTRDGSGTGLAHVFDGTFQAVDTVNGGDVILLYATGLGVTNPPGSTASGGVASEPLNRVVDGFDLYIGEQKVSQEDILFAGLAPGFPGVYQLNVRVPAGLATGRLFIRSRGWQSNITEVGIPAGDNVANVTGTIQGLFPATDPFDTPPYFLCHPGTVGCRPEESSFSAVLEAAAFSVSFDILPTAKPFAVAAVGEAGSSVIRIDPVRGTYEAVSTLPTAKTRAGDFAGTELEPITDFLTCDSRNGNASCTPAPGIPMSRTSIGERRAMDLLSLPDTEIPGSSMGLLRLSETALSGSRFVFEDLSGICRGYAAPTPCRFGGWLHIPFGPFDIRNSTFRLYVDGKLVTSKKGSYFPAHR